jgi:hypothetical protein
MQKLLDQSQQLQLMAENKIENFKTLATKKSTNNSNTTNASSQQKNIHGGIFGRK